MGRTILFVADSHFGALNTGLTLLNREANGGWTTSDIHFVMPDVGSASRDFMLDLADGRKILNPAVVREFDTPWSAPGRVTPQLLNRWTRASPLSGADHEVIFLWGFGEMHWFACESEWANFGIDGEIEDAPAADRRERYLLPKPLVRETLAALVGPVLEVVLYMIERGARVSTLAGPPPIPDNEYAEKKFPLFGRSSPSTRLMIYKILLEIFATHAAENGYRFHLPPSHVADEAGFRRPEFWGDAIHANDAYGREVLISLKAFMEGQAIS